jgi:hypothetical protein
MFGPVFLRAARDVPRPEIVYGEQIAPKERISNGYRKRKASVRAPQGDLFGLLFVTISVRLVFPETE